MRSHFLQLVPSLIICQISTAAVLASESKMLQGGVKSDTSLRSSLKVLPAALDEYSPYKPGINKDFSPLRADKNQANEAAQFGYRVPSYAIATPVSAGATTPVSEYTLRPGNSLLWSTAGYEYHVQSGQRTTITNTAATSSYSEPQPASVKGM